LAGRSLSGKAADCNTRLARPFAAAPVELSAQARGGKRNLVILDQRA